MVQKREVINVSIHKYAKHQRSGKPKYIITDKTGKVVVKANNHDAYMRLRKVYLDSLKQKKVSRD